MAVTRSDVRRLLGDLDDVTVEHILAMGPSDAELREAVGWLEGDEEVEFNLGEPSSTTVSRIVALVQSLEEEDPDGLVPGGPA